MTLPRLATAAGLALVPSIAWADPITAVAIIVNAAGYTAIAAGIALAGRIYGAVQARRQARRAAARQRAAYNANLQDRTVSVLRSDPPWQIVYGRTVVACHPLDIFAGDKTGTKTDGSTYTKADAYKHMVLMFASHECEAVHEVYIDGVAIGARDVDGWATGGEFAPSRTEQREITIAAGGSSTQVAAVTVLSAWDETLSSMGGDGAALVAGSYTLTNANKTINNSSGTNALRVSFTMQVTRAAVRVAVHLGADNQTVDTYLNTAAASRYTSAHRLRGIAYLSMTLDLEEPRFQGGLPNITVDVSGRKVADPRGAGSAWSDNAALCIGDYLAAPWGLSVDSSDPDELNRAAWVSAANVCAESVTLTVGGATQTNQKRYTINGAFRTEGAYREAVLEEMAEAMAGFVAPSAGWHIQAGSWTTPVLTLTDDDLVGLVEVVQSDTPGDELFNGIRGQLQLSGAQSPSDFNPYQNAAFVTADGGTELWNNIDLPFTNNLARARNLARIFVERNRSGQVIRYPANLRAWGLQVGDRVSVTHAELGLTGKLYRVTDVQLGIGASPVLLTLQEDAPDIWDDADAATADPTPNTDLPSPWVVTKPAGVSIISGTGTAGVGNGTIDTRARVTWNIPTDGYMAHPNARAIVRWRRQLRDANNVWLEQVVPATDGFAWLPHLRPGDGVSAGVAFRNQLGGLSDFTYASHNVVANGGTTTDLVTDVQGTVSGSIASGANRREEVLAVKSYTNNTGASLALEVSWRVSIKATASGGAYDSAKVRAYLSATSASVGDEADLTNTAYDNIPDTLSTTEYRLYVDTDTYTLAVGATVYAILAGSRKTGTETTTTFDGRDSMIRIVTAKR